MSTPPVAIAILDLVAHPTFAPQEDVWSAAKYPPPARNVPCSATVLPCASGTMVCSQSVVAPEAGAPETSPRDPRIAVEPFSTSRPRMRALVLDLTLQSSVVPKR